MKQVSIFLADGFEEVEALTVVDLLRRAGIRTDMVSVTGKKEVTGAHQISVKADVLFEETDFSDQDMLVLPGGMPGTLHLRDHEGLNRLLKQFYEEGRFVAAICAAPSVLGGLGFLEGRKACCYPSFEEKLTGAEVVFSPVVRDGNVITSRGLGTAIAFAKELIAALVGVEKADEVGNAIVL